MPAPQPLDFGDQRFTIELVQILVHDPILPEKDPAR